MSIAERAIDALAVWLEVQIRKLEDFIFCTEDPDKAEALLGIAADRRAAEVLAGTKEAGKVEEYLGELTRGREEALLNLEEAEAKAKQMIAEGRDESDPELVTQLKVVATLRSVAETYDTAVKSSLRSKEIVADYVHASELARQQAEAQDKATLALMRANHVQQLMTGRLRSLAELQPRKSSAIGERLAAAAARAHDRIQGEQNALQMVLEMRGKSAETALTSLTKEEKGIFASLQREVAAASGEAPEAARTRASQES